MARLRTDTSEGGRNPVRAKKSLGQNFLTAPSIAELIAKTALQSNPKTVFEIGPGTGMLTRALLANGAKVTAVEKDEELYARLREEFSSETQSDLLTLICGDALVETPEKLDFKPQSYSVAANIPYYITGEIIRMLLTTKTKPSSITLLVQKEVAERIVAKDGKESLLSNSVKLFGTPIYVKTVKAGSFSPAPKVDSAILHIENVSNEKLGVISEEDFFEILHAGFGHKRKQLGKTLGEQFGKETANRALSVCNILSATRPERLQVADWLCIATHLSHRDQISDRR